MLNTLLSNLTPEQRQQLASLVPGVGGGGTLTGRQAASLSPAAVQTVAQRVEQHDSGVIDKMSALYAAHPTLVKTLGSAAMMIAMRKIAERHSA
jgi:hypothetical protein